VPSTRTSTERSGNATPSASSARSRPNTSFRTISGNLAYLRKLASDPSYRVTSATSDDVQVRIAGDVAWVTAAWEASIVPLHTPDAVPHQDRGRYTGIYERRGGRWIIVTEHMSEAPHDPKVLEAHARTASERHWRSREAHGEAVSRSFRVIDNQTVLETGTIRNGTTQRRYTFVWSWQDLRWTLAASHESD
jgi:hypothetical protein